MAGHPSAELFDHFLFLRVLELTFHGFLEKTDPFFIVFVSFKEALVDKSDEIRVEAVAVYFGLFNFAINHVIGDLNHSPVKFIIDCILKFWTLTI